MRERPNIVLIVGDNHGCGAVGCYGRCGDDFLTPRIDRLAAEGVRFDHAFCANAYCSGSRATLLTGLMPSQHGVHSWLQDTLVASWPADWCAVAGLPTLPGLLREHGYATAHVGKWHLGVPWTRPAFYDSWVSFALGDTLDFYDNEVVVDGRRERLAGRHVVDFFSEQAVRRVGELAGDDPFFLSVWYDGPYALPPTNLGADPRNPFYAAFAGSTFPSVPRVPVDEGLIRLLRLERYPDEGFREFLWDVVRMQNDTASLANFAAQVALVDQGVGQIVDAVDEAGIGRDTLVVYTTDQANLFGQHGVWGHATSFVPTRLYDDLMRIPLICRQPGAVPPGRVADRLTGQYDIAPALADWAGCDPAAFAGPGRSFATTLRGAGETAAPDAVWFEQEETRAIRTHRFAYWKRHEPLGAFWRELGLDWDGSPCLYDHATDPGEERSVADDPAYAAAVLDLDARLNAFFARHADPRYDLWRGGVAKGSVDWPQAYRRAYGDAWRLEGGAA